jgi:hypothetical protein
MNHSQFDKTQKLTGINPHNILARKKNESICNYSICQKI